MQKISCLSLAILLFCLVVAAAVPVKLPMRATGTQIDTTKYSKVLYVSLIGNDTSSGMKQSMALKTIGVALQRARNLLNQGFGVKIAIAPGIYRESHTPIIDGLTLGPRGKESLLFVEGQKEGSVTISGAVSWMGSTFTVSKENPKIFQRPWPYKFDGNTIFELGSDASLNDHNEILFLNQKQLRQRATKSSLDSGSFFIDDSAKILFVYPKKAIVSSDTIDVGQQSGLLRILNKSNVVVRNIVFKHDVSWITGHGNDGDTWGVAVKFTSTDKAHDLFVENCQFNNCNAGGLNFNNWNNVTISKCKANGNGWKGIGFGSSNNVLIKDCETSFNAWRQMWVNGSGVDAAGLKIIPFNKCVTVLRHYANNNTVASAIWLDWGNTDVILDSCIIENNQFYPLYIESSIGPVTAKNCVVRNAEYGFTLFSQENMRFDHCRFEGIKKAMGCLISDNRMVDGKVLSNKNCTIQFCSFEGNELFDFEKDQKYGEFLKYLSISNNVYQPNSTKADFNAYKDSKGERVSFEKWKASGKDLHSSIGKKIE